MGPDYSGVTRRYLPQSGVFIFYRDGKEIARKHRDVNGNVKVEGEIPDGIIRSFYEDENGNETDKLFAEWNYKNGKLEGISRIYLENGQLDEEFNYCDGKIESIIKKHYEDGHLTFESTFHNTNGQVIFKEY